MPDSRIPPQSFPEEFDRDQLAGTWSWLGRTWRPPMVRPEDTDQDWIAVERRIQGGSRVRRSFSRWVPGRAAAVAALLLGATLAWQLTPAQISADPGEHLAVRLPDGSQVTLNAGSELTFRRGFSLLPGVKGSDRSVRLEGEAFFEVVPSPRPFRIETGDATVRVLGTRFNVRAWSGQTGEVRVAVEEGLVEVLPDDGTEVRMPALLGPGEALRLEVGTGVIRQEPVTAGRVATWRSGGLTVVDEPLSAVLAELSRVYGVEVTLAAPERGDDHLSVFYPELGSMESVLSDLSTQGSFRFRRTTQGWEIF